MKVIKLFIITAILGSGFAVGVYFLGKNHAEQATQFLDGLENTISDIVVLDVIPPDHAENAPSGILARIFSKHPNNEIVKGVTFVVNPDQFARAHPNNEISKAYSILTSPHHFIDKHPNNELAKTLQILTDVEGFYTNRPNNDLGKVLHVIADPDDFVAKHPNNDLAKALQIAKGDLSKFRKHHPNNEISRAIAEIERLPKNIKKCFGLC